MPSKLAWCFYQHCEVQRRMKDRRLEKSAVSVGGHPEVQRIRRNPGIQRARARSQSLTPCLIFVTSLSLWSHLSNMPSSSSRTFSAGISFPLKVIMRIDEIMFVKEFCKHQREGAAWISRVAVSEGNHDSLLLYCLPQRPMTIAPLPHSEPGCQLWGARNSKLRSQCFP